MSIYNYRLTDRRLWGEVLDMAILNRNVNIVRQLVLRGVQVEKHHMMTFFGHDGSEFDLFNVLAQSFYNLDDHGEEDDEEEIDEEDDEEEIDEDEEDEEDAEHIEQEDDEEGTDEDEADEEDEDNDDCFQKMPDDVKSE